MKQEAGAEFVMKTFNAAGLFTTIKGEFAVQLFASFAYTVYAPDAKPLKFRVDVGFEKLLAKL